jgi:hypothetical protein
MNALTNNKGFNLSMAVWLAHDDYNPTEGIPAEHAGKNVISITSLLKPVRQLILANRIPKEEQTVDIADRIAPTFGHAIHESIENAWTKGYANAMRRLGYPEKVIEKIRINPGEQERSGDIIPVYLEQRAFRSVMVDGVEIIISGKFDAVVNGEIHDNKSTSAYTAISGSKDRDYQIQLSAYKWLNPAMVTSDIGYINYIFTDWQPSQARANPLYPQDRIKESRFHLLSEADTNTWIISRLKEIIRNQNLEEPDIVRCTQEELWMSDPVFKYYSDPKKAAEGGRATKNFPNYPAAAAYLNKQGKGTIITVESEPKACGYCPAFSLCSQQKEYPANQAKNEEDHANE